MAEKVHLSTSLDGRSLIGIIMERMLQSRFPEQVIPRLRRGRVKSEILPDFQFQVENVPVAKYNKQYDFVMKRKSGENPAQTRYCNR